MFKFGYFTNFKALFGVVSTDFPEVVHVKSWKNREKAYVRTHCSRSLSNWLTSHPSWLPPDWTDSPSVQYMLKGRFILWIASIEKVLSCNVYRGAGMAQWWEHSPSTNVARVRFPDLTSYVGWVCCWFSSLLGERFFSGYSSFPLSAKTNISKFQFDAECSSVWYMSPRLGRLGNHSSRYRA